MTEFSICIPNFNYEKYLNLTLKSVQEQTYPNFNVYISDNASTDDSVGVMKKYALHDSRFSYKVNLSNVGFAGNLDKCGDMADKEWMIMLSSDDVMKSDALQEYQKFISLLSSSEQSIFTSTFDKIDSEGNHISYIKPNPVIWKETDIEHDLTSKMGCNVYKVKSSEMLKRCLERFYNPFNFAATCYLKHSYSLINGYGGGRVYNPDKWFHWKIMTVSDYVYFIDKPLFQYRWHQQNQQSLEKEADVLKFWYDEYRNCFEVDAIMLKQVDLERKDIINFYCNHLVKYIFADIKTNKIASAKRLINWGKACYPKIFKRNKFYYSLVIMSKFGIFGNYLSNLFNKFNKK